MPTRVESIILALEVSTSQAGQTSDSRLQTLDSRLHTPDTRQLSSFLLSLRYNPILLMEREKAYPNGNHQKPIVPCRKQGGRIRP